MVSNLIALGADVGVISVLGDDSAGREIIAMLASCKAKAELVLQERGRKSSQKSRIMVSHQQVLRVDNESTDEITVCRRRLVLFCRKKGTDGMEIIE